MCRRSNKLSRRAFTLIEIIVSIFVIAVLIGITIPSLAAARHSARDAVSMSNLKSLGVAIELYQLEHEGLMPYFVPGLGRLEESGRVTLTDALSPYLNSTEVLWAPADPIVRNEDPAARFEYSSYSYVPGELMGYLDRLTPGEVRLQARAKVLYDLRGGTVFRERGEWSGRFGGGGRYEISLPDWTVRLEEASDERHSTGYRPAFSY